MSSSQINNFQNSNISGSGVDNTSARIKHQINNFEKLSDEVFKDATINKQENYLFIKKFSNGKIANFFLLLICLLLLAFVVTSIIFYNISKTFISFKFAQIVLYLSILFFLIFVIYIYKYIIEIIAQRKIDRIQEIENFKKFYQDAFK